VNVGSSHGLFPLCVVFLVQQLLFRLRQSLHPLTHVLHKFFVRRMTGEAVARQQQHTDAKVQTGVVPGVPLQHFHVPFGGLVGLDGGGQRVLKQACTKTSH
jgi:hypothetical protein